MFIAFEGPDEVGKTTLSTELAHDHKAIYNATKENYRLALDEYRDEPDLVVTFDRIDWLTHMMYRLAMPDKEWNDERIRTVFAMPETHLVLSVHQPDLVPEAEGENYTELHSTKVNQAYYHFLDILAGLNKAWNYSLWKSVTAFEISRNEDGSFFRQLRVFDAPGFPWGSSYENLVTDGPSLLELLRYADNKIG
ncbi:AAA-ATPase [Microbacterium phage McGalleon]|uniref:AAA-ATPase n=1 Tax=Microbacterium phage McGalleon TaxID=2590936 RepID=A0A516KQX5_9CAUD|nr:thymidylate kinase [Microbacterium phage McGalleon]QDP44100.1 AAA-ATPase [Microbacterium phage McGalleon]